MQGSRYSPILLPRQVHELSLSLAVPRSARGPLEIDVQAHRTLVDLPCAGIEEYDRSTMPWGRIR